MLIDAAQVAAVRDATTAHAVELGIAVSIAIVDDGGYLLSFVRMDGAHKLTPQMAISKAYTAAIYRRATSEMATMPAELLRAARHAGLYTLLTMPGGVPLRVGDELVGGVGVAGASPERDAECAEVGAELLQRGEAR
jgi:glc operon protein GlcG